MSESISLNEKTNQIYKVDFNYSALIRQNIFLTNPKGNEIEFCIACGFKKEIHCDIA